MFNISPYISSTRLIDGADKAKLLSAEFLARSVTALFSGQADLQIVLVPIALRDAVVDN